MHARTETVKSFLTVSTDVVAYDESEALVFPIEKCVIPRAPQYPGDDNCEKSVVTGWTSTRQLEVLSAKLEQVKGGKSTLIGETPLIADFTASQNPANMPTSFEGMPYSAAGTQVLSSRIFSNASWFYGSPAPGISSPNVLAKLKTKVQNNKLTPLSNGAREALLIDFAASTPSLSLFVENCAAVTFQKQ